jgi:hypothetical protein
MIEILLYTLIGVVLAIVGRTLYSIYKDEY